MIDLETRRAINEELDRNLENIPSKIAFLIYDLQTFSDYKPKKRQEILQKAIEQLRG